MSRAELREIRSQSAAAAKRSKAATPQALARVEWDMARARVNRIKDPSARDAAWRGLAGVLSGFGYG